MTPAQAATLRRRKMEEMAREFQQRADAHALALAGLDSCLMSQADLAMAAERDVYTKCAEVTRSLAAGVLTP